MWTELAISRIFTECEGDGIKSINLFYFKSDGLIWWSKFKDGIQITVKIDDDSKHLPREALGHQRTPKSWKFRFLDFKIDLKLHTQFKILL